MVVVLNMKQEKGVWTQPALAPFNKGTYTHINSVSPDGKRLYFFSENDGAWVVNKTENGWSEPHLLNLNDSDKPGRHINEVHEARSGNLYLSGPLNTMPGGRGIVRSIFMDGKYQEYESLGPNVNFPHNDPYPNHSPTVNPDERFVIFVSRRPGGFGSQDLYISYRQTDDTWGPAINLGPKINSIGDGNSWPQLSPDEKFLFFVSYINPYNENDFNEKKYSFTDLKEIEESIFNGWGNIYWVSTSFVEQLKPAK
jgi:Tol biopolymer transport system component